MEDRLFAQSTPTVIDVVLRESFRVTNMPTKQGACDTEHKMEVWERTTEISCACTCLIPAPYALGTVDSNQTSSNPLSWTCIDRLDWAPNAYKVKNNAVC